jgi:3-methyladenine DNA glycosylase/8-oxoguanine DNA glycosylase
MRAVWLAYRPPFDWAGMLAFLAPRATAGVEIVEGGVYRRTVELDGQPGVIEVASNGSALRVRAPRRHVSRDARARVRRLFDLDANPAAITAHLGRHRRLARLVATRPGLRVPGAWDPFELAVRAVLGQQVTVRAATTLAGRLVATFGQPVRDGGRGLTHLFPRPEALAEADVVRIGMPAARASTIRAVARAAAGALSVAAGAGLEDTVARLCAIPGIGPWTAHYIALRGLGMRDAFPAADLGLRRALANGCGVPSASALERIAETWRPWRGYAAIHLWSRGGIT